MNNKKQMWLSILRGLLSFIGMYLVGKSFLGTTLNTTVLEMLSGSLMTVASLIWSYIDKEVGIEAFEGAIRNLLTGVGGILIGSGILKPGSIEILLGILPAIFGLLQSYLTRKKNDLLDRGRMDTGDLIKLK